MGGLSARLARRLATDSSPWSLAKQMEATVRRDWVGCNEQGCIADHAQYRLAVRPPGIAWMSHYQVTLPGGERVFIRRAYPRPLVAVQETARAALYDLRRGRP